MEGADNMTVIGTRAPGPRRFWINSLGEFGRIEENGDDIMGGGSVSISDLNNLPDEEREIIVEHRFRKQKEAFCTPDELAVMGKFDEVFALLQDEKYAGRVNVYAGFVYGDEKIGNLPNGEPFVRLTMEFKELAEKNCFWLDLRSTAMNHDWDEPELMWEDVDRGHWKDSDTLPKNFSSLTDEQRRTLTQYVPAEHEGKTYHQYEVTCNVIHLDSDEIVDIIQAFLDDTDKLWEQAGVSVI